MELNDRLQPNNRANANVYEKWRKRKTKSEAEDKRLLTNLVGTDWVSIGQHGDMSFNFSKRNKKTIRERMETFQDDERKKVNKNLM